MELFRRCSDGLHYFVHVVRRIEIEHASELMLVKWDDQVRVAVERKF